MSNKKPIKIVINKTIEVQPEGVYRSSVVKSGNGAVINFFKRFIKRKVIVIVEDENDKQKQE